VIFGLALALLVFLAAAPAAEFYAEPRVFGVMAALAAGIAASGFENIGVVAFLKELDFRKEFVLRLAQKASSVLITVPLAFALRSYWALIIGQVCGTVITVAISYYAHPFRPRVSFAASRHLFGFSKWILAGALLRFLRDRSPHYLLGRISGPAALGLFTVGQEIANLPTAELVAPINRAVFPAYAKIAHDRAALRRGFLDIIALVLLAALPAGFGIAATADFIVTVALGEQWVAAIPIVSILAVFGALNALQTNCDLIHFSMGRPETIVKIGCVQLLVLLPSVAWGAYQNGAVGIAWAYLLNVAILSIPLNYAVVLYRLELSITQVLVYTWRPVGATIAMHLAVSAWKARWAEPSLVNLLAAIAVGGATYVAAIGALWWAAGRPAGPEQTISAKFLLPAWNRIVSFRQAPG
jgi:O-antigen/teichoic acid export membrane protein